MYCLHDVCMQLVFVRVANRYWTTSSPLLKFRFDVKKRKDWYKAWKVGPAVETPVTLVHVVSGLLLFFSVERRDGKGMTISAYGCLRSCPEQSLRERFLGKEVLDKGRSG